MKAIMRRSLGLESSVELTTGSSDEISEVAGIDVQELFGEVDAEGHHAPNVVERVLNDIDTVVEITDVLEKHPDGELSEASLSLAQETLNAIFSRHDVKTRSISSERFEGKRMTAKEVIAYATEAADEVGKKYGNDLDTLIKRMTSEIDYITRTKQSWRNQAIKLRNAAGAVSGEPTDALFTNRVTIAHMTKGDKTPLKSAGELQDIVNRMKDPVDGMVMMLSGVSSTFSSFLNQTKGSVDFDRVTASFEKSHFFPGTLSLTGPDAIFGEETVMDPVQGQTDNLPDMMKTLARAAIHHNSVWEISDLPQSLQLKVKSSVSIQKEIDTLINIGEDINKQFIYFNTQVKPFVWELRRNFLIPVVSSWFNTLHIYTSPIKFIRYRIRYAILLFKLVNAAQRVYRHNFKAADALMSYYMWSLKNTK